MARTQASRHAEPRAFLRGLIELAASLAAHEVEDLPKALADACQRSLGLVGVDGVAFWERREGTLALAGSAGLGRDLSRSVIRPIPAWSAGATSQVVAATTPEAVARYVEAGGLRRRIAMVLEFPVRYRRIGLGVVWFLIRRRRALALIQERAIVIADQLAHALARSHNFRLIARAISELDTVRRVAESIMASRDLREILVQVTESARRLLTADAAVIGLFADDGGSMRLASRGPVAADLDQAVLRLSPASAAAARRELEARLHGEGVEALRTLDLGLQGDTLGVFTLAWRRARTLNRNDEQMMSSLAAHASIAIQNARLFERLTLRRNELRRLARQQMHAEEEQRRGIARELHDELGQSLTALLIDARRRAAHGTASAPEWVQMAEELERVVASMREISYRLRPPMLDVLGLSESLRWLASSVSRHTSRPVSVQTSVSRRLAEPAELCLYRVAQEALTNAIRHSGASRISVRLREAEGQVWLSVTDDGCGFDAARNDRGKGLGLLVMRERVAELGGTFSVQSAPREGVRIEARLPSDDSAYRTNQASAG